MESVVSHFRKYSMSMHLVTTSVTSVQGQKMDAEKPTSQDSIRKDRGNLTVAPRPPTSHLRDFSVATVNWENSLRSLSMSLTFWLWSGNVLEVYIKKTMEGWWMSWDVDTGRCNFMALCSILEHCVDGIYADFLLHNGTSFKPCLMVHQSKIFWCIKVAVVVSCRTLFALWKDAIPMPYSLRKTLNKVISNHS